MTRERKRTHSLLDSEDKDSLLRQQALLLELTPVIVHDPNDKITLWNRSAEVLYGFTKSQAVGRISHELLQTKFPEPLDNILARLRSGRQWSGDLLQVRSDGLQISVASEWIAYQGRDGELEAIFEVAREITDHKRVEEDLARATARFDGIIASAMDAIISLDVNQRIVLFNPAAEVMFGVSSEAALGRDIGQFIPARFRDAHRHHVEHFSETGVSSRRMGSLGTISGLRANGQEFPIEASISQVEIGKERLFTVILRDITERQRVEKALREAQVALTAHAENLEKAVARRTAELRETNSELEAFSYSLSHDLRAPLRAILAFTRIAIEDYGKLLGTEGEDLLRRVVTAAERMERLMQDVLAFSQISRQEIQLAPIDPEKILLDVVLERPELQAPRAEIKIEGPLLPVEGNQACLTQCLGNFLTNAAKFVAPGTTPKIRVGTEARARSSDTTPLSQTPEPARVSPSANAPANTGAGAKSKSVVRIWIEDNGIGIEKGAQRKIFEMFQRLHSEYPGTGFGLAIARKAAERMGAVLGVESEPGKGSRFWVELPPARNPVQPAAK